MLPKKSNKISNDSLFAFLNSQFNVEYVYLILMGLSKLYGEDLLKKQKKNLLNRVQKRRKVTDAWVREAREQSDFSIEIEKLKYKDLETWNVVEQKQ